MPDNYHWRLDLAKFSKISSIVWQGFSFGIRIYLCGVNVFWMVFLPVHLERFGEVRTLNPSLEGGEIPLVKFDAPKYAATAGVGNYRDPSIL